MQKEDRKCANRTRGVTCNIIILFLTRSPAGIELGRCNYVPYKISVAFWLVWLSNIDNFPVFLCKTFFVKGMASWQVLLLPIQRIFHTTTCEFVCIKLCVLSREGQYNLFLRSCSAALKLSAQRDKFLLN